MLRRHVRQSTSNQRDRRCVGEGLLSQIEVENQWFAILREENIRRLEIAMDDPVFVAQKPFHPPRGP